MRFRPVRALPVLVLALLAAVSAAVPAARAQTVPETRHPIFFEQTGHGLSHTFTLYWRRQGGLPIFGYALSEAWLERNADTGRLLPTQYFERARLESHGALPEPYTIQLGRLGVELLQRQGRPWETLPKADPATPRYFPETGHAIAFEPFWQYWRRYGLELGDPGISERESLAFFGYPISEPQMETNADGDTVLTQWFERARFEWHPHNPEPYKVLLGRLGSEISQGRAHEAPFRPISPRWSVRDGVELRAAALETLNRERSFYGFPPVRYRDDLQAVADQAALEWWQARRGGGDDNAVSDRWHAWFNQQSPRAGAILWSGNVPLKLRDVPCSMDMVDPDVGYGPLDPRAYIPAEYNPASLASSVTAITVGTTPVFEGPCGPSVAIVFVTSY